MKIEEQIDNPEKREQPAPDISRQEKTENDQQKDETIVSINIKETENKNK